MSNRKLLRKILRLKSLKITCFWFMHREKELHLAVKPYKNGCRCPACGRRGRIVHQTTELRRWEDIALIGTRVLLWYAPKEIQCPTHGRVQEEIPWAAAYARISYRLEWRICALCQLMTQKAAAEILLMPTSTLSNLLHRVITRVRRGHTIRALVSLGVDEISFCKGRKFATLVYDLDRAQVLWVGPGKGRDTIDRFFNDGLSTGQKARIAWASCDMSPAYIGAITHHCPHVTLVIDRFHLVKALNQAVDEVRKEQWRALDTPGRTAIKGLRWLLSMHSRHRTKGHTRFLNNLRNSNRRIHRAWVLKDEFEHFWTYRYRASAEKFLRRWMTAALRSRIPTLRQFVATLRTHLEHILAFIDRHLTNAVGEGPESYYQNRQEPRVRISRYSCAYSQPFACPVRDVETVMTQRPQRISLVGTFGYSLKPTDAGRSRQIALVLVPERAYKLILWDYPAAFPFEIDLRESQAKLIAGHYE